MTKEPYQLKTVSTRIFQVDHDYLMNKRGSKGFAHALHEILVAWERTKPE